MKEFIVAVWEVRKQKLYGDDSYPGQLQRQSSAGDRGPVAGVGGGRVGKLAANPQESSKQHIMPYGCWTPS